MRQPLATLLVALGCQMTPSGYQVGGPTDREPPVDEGCESPEGPPHRGVPEAASDLHHLGDTPAHLVWREPHPPNPVPDREPGQMTCVFDPDDPDGGTLTTEEVTCLSIARESGRHRRDLYYDAAGRLVMYRYTSDVLPTFTDCYHYDEYGGVVVEEHDDHFYDTPGVAEAVVWYAYERDQRGRPLRRRAQGADWYFGDQDDVAWVWSDDDRLLEIERTTTAFWYDLQPEVQRWLYSYDGQGRRVRLEVFNDERSRDLSVYSWVGGVVAFESTELWGEPSNHYTYLHDDHCRIDSVADVRNGATVRFRYPRDAQGRVKWEQIDDNVFDVWTWGCPWE